MADLAMNNLSSIFRGKRVLITGDTGFKGSWLSLWLHELGADVVGYALPAEHEKGLFLSAKLQTLIHHIDGDIRDVQSLVRLTKEFQPEFLFHLAAQSLVRRSYQEPKLTFDTNVGGSVNVLEVVRATSSLRSVVYITSDKCYLNKEWIWGYRESDELGGHDPYSASKSAAEMVFYAYSSSFFKNRSNLGIASTRAGNVIGGGDWSADRIVPDSVRALGAGEPIQVRNPDSTRPWQHVLEPLSGYLLLAANLSRSPQAFNGSWNFGPRSESIQPVRALVERIIHHWGQGILQIHNDLDAPHEARLLQLNCDKAFHKLSWMPRWNFERTISETVHWYREVHEGRSAREISRKQVIDYMEGSDD